MLRHVASQLARHAIAGAIAITCLFLIPPRTGMNLFDRIELMVALLSLVEVFFLKAQHIKVRLPRIRKTTVIPAKQTAA